MQQLYLLVPLAPLAGSLIAGLAGKLVGRAGAHWVTNLGVAIAFFASLYIFFDVLEGNGFNGPVYTWMTVGNVKFEIGFLIDRLTITMMLVVSFVSWMVHIYTIGYMADDPGYQRFFSYISLFTFSMLMLVMANNFLQLFFGWEAVGLMSYLLIGFWFTRPTATYASLKAFLVNRVGDFGFLLGIGLVLAHTQSLDYATVFKSAQLLSTVPIEIIPGLQWSLLSVICICLFIGAMGKSAQFPLHVWLPDSMEGPTPISALIHAATMVTAGIFMVARMSPLFELSEAALSFVLVIGAITALFMGFLGMIQNDIKRVVAYSTLSQLGYMTVALGASAYSAAIFHLMTHAFFKALLFLAAGSVILAMHHDQDIRNMGGLWRYVKITWLTALVGTLALVGTPFFSGFYSKDSIIQAVHASHIPGAGFAYFAVASGVFVTAFYSFRMFFLVFHGKERFGRHHHEAHEEEEELSPDHEHGLAPGEKPHEPGWVVWLPLIVLAIPSAIIGYLTIEPILFGNWFGNAIVVAPRHPAMHELSEEFHGALAMGLHGLTGLPFSLALAGFAVAWLFYLRRPDIPGKVRNRFGAIYTLLDNKYYFDKFNDWFFARGARRVGRGLWRFGDVTVIDGLMVNGTAKLIGLFSGVIRRLQTGYIYNYAFIMIFGVFGLLSWFLYRLIWVS